MQVAHKEGEKGGYLTVKDNQVRAVEYIGLLLIEIRSFDCIFLVVSILRQNGSYTTSLYSPLQTYVSNLAIIGSN